jgi:hypothetical protein
MLGNDPRALVTLRSDMFSDSIALVVKITFRISGGCAKNGITRAPVAAPGLRNGGKLRSPLQAKLSQSSFGLGFSRGAVDQLQVGRHFLALFPAHIVQRVPHQVHDA